MLDGYRFRTTHRSHKLFQRRRRIYEALDKSLPLFVRIGDDISRNVIANGVYEPEIKALIDGLRDSGHGDFLIDIGANIGLTSCQSGTGFREVHCYEPNPDCVSILRVNLKLALGGETAWTVHGVGLGSKEETLSLHVPTGNWGGAFIKGADNAYDEALLSRKDGFAGFEASNYAISHVRIIAAAEELARLFDRLAGQGLRNGVIKIDVEGYELVILESIFEVLPRDMEVTIVFENWADIDQPRFLDTALESHRLRTMRLRSDKEPLPALPHWINSLYNVARGGYDTTLVEASGRWSAGTYALGLTPHTVTRAA